MNETHFRLIKYTSKVFILLITAILLYNLPKLTNLYLDNAGGEVFNISTAPIDIVRFEDGVVVEFDDIKDDPVRRRLAERVKFVSFMKNLLLFGLLCLGVFEYSLYKLDDSGEHWIGWVVKKLNEVEK